MTKLIPRWYQQEACDEVINALTAASNTNPLAAIVTGGGKALIAAMLVQRLNLQWPGSRIMVLAPSMELVKQNVDEAMGYLPDSLIPRVGVYCAGLNMRNRLSQFIFGTPQSVARQVKRFSKMDFIIVDEAHIFDLGNKTGERIVKGFTEMNPNIRFIGLTATPFRMKGAKVVPLTQGGIFNALVYDLTSGKNFNRLTREGFLAPVVAPALRFPQIDTEGVKTRGGDFDEEELARRASKITSECVAVALDHAPDRKHFMWFAVNIDHARMIYGALSEAGESAVIIHGELDKNERVTGIDEYLKKQHRHIVSVAMLTTGFNAKFVDAIVNLRPSRSLVLFRQIIGRGLRPYPGKENVLVLDAGGNFARHGPINAATSIGDSRTGLWLCTDEIVHTPFAGKREDGSPMPEREKSAIRFPVSSEAPESDLRLILSLMESETPPCGFFNDAEHMTCRQCGRPRQGFLTFRTPRERKERGLGSDDTYEIHDEDNVVLRDEACRESRTISVLDMELVVSGNSLIEFSYKTEVGEVSLKLDFDRTSADNKYFAQARKYYEVATGRKIPKEAYRVLLQRNLFAQPVDITLTKFEDGNTFLTEVRFIRDEKLECFRYDPTY